ncbi:Cell division control protein 3 [Savitreella phatthalungensis]
MSDNANVVQPPLERHHDEQMDTDQSEEPVFTPASPPPVPSTPQTPSMSAPTTSKPAAAQPATASAPPVATVVKRKLTGFVGFANLPAQWHRKSVRKGFEFTVMLVGESGLGKSTMVNTLLNSDTYGPKNYQLGGEQRNDKTVSTTTTTALVQEDGVSLQLSIVDTPGFGDFINNEECWRPILQRIEQGYDSYLDQENAIDRKEVRDERVHACLFFIDPTGHALKPIEIEFMRRLHQRVNLIPVIAKADLMTAEETDLFKRRVLADLEYHRIQTFTPPRYALDDEETLAESRDMLSRVPFAIVGSNTIVNAGDGRRVRGRQYPWGVIEVDNESHCDTAKLRQMLIRTHMEELKDHTRNTLYENYRTEKLTAMGITQDPSVFKEVSPQAKLEEERALHEARLAKMESEMRTVFQQKVQEKEAKLKQSEEELYSKHRQMKEDLNNQRLEAEDKRQRILSGQLTPAPTQDDNKGRRGKFSLGGR